MSGTLNSGDVNAMATLKMTTTQIIVNVPKSFFCSGPLANNLNELKASEPIQIIVSM
jgi:hypothetical protein